MRLRNDSMEHHILVAMITNPIDRAEGIELFSAEDFADTNSRNLYKVISKLEMDGLTINTHTIQSALSEVMDGDYLSANEIFLKILEGGSKEQVCLRDWVSDIRTMTKRRKLLEIANGVMEIVRSPSLDPDTVDATVQDLVDGSTVAYTSDELKTFADLAREALEKAEEANVSDSPSGFSWGFDSLDSVTRPDLGNLVVLGARNAMGKTSLLLQVAQSWCINRPVIFAQMEQAEVDLGRRMVSGYSGVTFKKISEGNLSDAEWREIHHAVHIMQDFDNAYSMVASSIDEVISKAKVMETKLGVMPLVIVDYLQLLIDSSNPNINFVIIEAVDKLKKLAMRKGKETVCLLASQLNKDVDERQDTGYVPRKKDFPYSSAIADKADIMLAMVREGAYYINDPYWTGNRALTKFYFLKIKNGRTTIPILNSSGVEIDMEVPCLMFEAYRFTFRDETSEETSNRRMGITPSISDEMVDKVDKNWWEEDLED